MVKIDDVTMLYEESRFRESVNTIDLRSHSRYPLFIKEKREYLGNVYLPVLLTNYGELESGDKQLRDLVMGKMVREDSISISKLIDAFQDEQQELCMLQCDGAFTGLVTQTDAFEAVFREMRDPLDK